MEAKVYEAEAEVEAEVKLNNPNQHYRIWKLAKYGIINTRRRPQRHRPQRRRPQHP